MRSNIPRVALPAVLLTLPLFGCGDVAPIPGIAPDQAPSKLAQAVCERAYECCMTSQLMDNDQAGATEAECVTKTQAAFQNRVNSIKSSEKKGRVVYDGLKVEACLKQLQDSTCSDLNMTNHLSGVSSCSSEFLQPKVAVGGACGIDFECVESHCDRSALPQGSTADGVCKAFAKVGETCNATTLCGKDLTCDTATTTCKAATPAPPPANACFYSSACNFSGGDRGAASLLTVGLLALAIALRRRTNKQV